MKVDCVTAVVPVSGKVQWHSSGSAAGAEAKPDMEEEREKK
jgi:hypothetical protein